MSIECMRWGFLLQYTDVDDVDANGNSGTGSTIPQVWGAEVEALDSICQVKQCRTSWMKNNIHSSLLKVLHCSLDYNYKPVGGYHDAMVSLIHEESDMFIGTTELYRTQVFKI